MHGRQEVFSTENPPTYIHFSFHLQQFFDGCRGPRDQKRHPSGRFCCVGVLHKDWFPSNRATAAGISEQTCVSAFGALKI